jgi:hypothetical protein
MSEWRAIAGTMCLETGALSAPASKTLPNRIWKPADLEACASGGLGRGGGRGAGRGGWHWERGR